MDRFPFGDSRENTIGLWRDEGATAATVLTLALTELDCTTLVAALDEARVITWPLEGILVPPLVLILEAYLCTPDALPLVWSNTLNESKG